MAVHARYQAMKAASQKRVNVDTKASKGRKIRYDIHPKLVGFMAPHARDETFSSAAVDAVFWPESKTRALIETISWQTALKSN